MLTTDRPSRGSPRAVIEGRSFIYNDVGPIIGEYRMDSYFRIARVHSLSPSAHSEIIIERVL